MKRLVCLVGVVVVLTSLMGCPSIGMVSIGNGKLVGTWQWVQPSALLEPGVEADYNSLVVAQNFANQNRLRKTVIFNEEGNFTYIEETFLPDREAGITDDKGAAVVWAWIETYRAAGTYKTARFAATNTVFTIPGLDLELNVNITEYTDTFARNKRDLDGELLRDSEGRIMLEYLTATSQADAENPLYLRALMGMNPFDELMIGWDDEVVPFDKDLEYNEGIYVETYVRMPE